MKDKMTMLKTIAMLLLFGVALFGCASTGSQQMMDDSMAAPMETMNHEPMANEMDNGDEEMTVPMDNMHHMDTMENDSMNSGMMDTMK